MSRDKKTLERIERMAGLKYGYTSENSSLYKDILFLLDNSVEAKQTKRQSLIETITNTSVGFAISLLATFLILPLFGIISTPTKNVGVTLCFTAISILRGYIIRRYFNSK